jgi:hypothetical protein
MRGKNLYMILALWKPIPMGIGANFDISTQIQYNYQ